MTEQLSPPQKRRLWPWIVGVLLAVVVLGTVIDPPSSSPAPKTSGLGRMTMAMGKMHSIAPTTFALTIPASAQPALMMKAAREACAAKQICQVLAWTDESDMAKAMPMLDREAAALAFNYSMNRNTGFEQMLWDCARWPVVPTDQCMATSDDAESQ